MIGELQATSNRAISWWTWKTSSLAPFRYLTSFRFSTTPRSGYPPRWSRQLRLPQRRRLVPPVRAALPFRLPQLSCYWRKFSTRNWDRRAIKKRSLRRSLLASSLLFKRRRRTSTSAKRPCENAACMPYFLVLDKRRFFVIIANGKEHMPSADGWRVFVKRARQPGRT